METCHPLHLGVTDKFRNSLHPHFITWSTVYISTIFQLDEITKCPYTLKNDQRRSEKWSHWIIISPKNKCLSLTLCRCIVAYIYDPAGAPELRVENPRISGARNSKSVKTPENRHPKTPTLGRLWLRFDGAFSGACFRVFWKANSRVSGAENSTFDHPKKTPEVGVRRQGRIPNHCS